MWKSRQDLERKSRAGSEYAYIGKNLALCRILNKYKLFVDTRDISLSPHLIMDGYWEAWITLLISRLVKPGMTCIDVGANVGYYSILIADIVGDNGKVLALEPYKHVHDLLILNRNINDLKSRIDIHKLAAWDSPADLFYNEIEDDCGTDIYLDICHMGSGFVSDEEGSLSYEEVQGLPLDAIYTEKVVDFIKIDAEGSEPRIIQGIKGCVEANPDILVLFEWSPGKPGFDNGLLDLVKSYGLVPAKVNDDGVSLNSIPNPPEKMCMILAGKDLLKVPNKAPINLYK